MLVRLCKVLSHVKHAAHLGALTLPLTPCCTAAYGGHEGNRAVKWEDSELDDCASRGSAPHTPVRRDCDERVVGHGGRATRCSAMGGGARLQHLRMSSRHALLTVRLSRHCPPHTAAQSLLLPLKMLV